jgi:hypothetical protein
VAQRDHGANNSESKEEEEEDERPRISAQSARAPEQRACRNERRSSRQPAATWRRGERGEALDHRELQSQDTTPRHAEQPARRQRQDETARVIARRREGGSG